MHFSILPYLTVPYHIMIVDMYRRGCAKDWTVTGPQDQLKFGLTGPPSSFTGLNYCLYVLKFSWFGGQATTEINWSSWKRTGGGPTGYH